MFKKLLPILGLLLLVSCEGELTEKQIEDAVNGTSTETIPPKPITNWLDKADFLANKTCTVTETTLTNEFINDVASNDTSVNFFIGQEFKLGNGDTHLSKATLKEYIRFEDDNTEAKMNIRSDEAGEYNTMTVSASAGSGENLSIRVGSYTLNDAGTVVGTMEWMRTDVGRDYRYHTMFNQETEVFTITLNCK